MKIDISSNQIAKAIYEATYDAWMEAFGGGSYPLTADGMHQTISKAIQKAWASEAGQDAIEKALLSNSARTPLDQ